MAQKKTTNLLPRKFRTTTNSKFINGAIEPLLTEPELRRMTGFVGRRLTRSYNKTDTYIQENNSARQFYQLEPALVVRDPDSEKTKLTVSYRDLINKLRYLDCTVANESLLFEEYYYNYYGYFDLDKFVNYAYYYWIPDGLPSVAVYSYAIPLEQTFLVTVDTSANVFRISTYDSDNPTLTLARGGVYQFNNLSGEPFWIETPAGGREVYGVVNNGRGRGIITFNVPYADEQDAYRNLPVEGTVDLACTIPYNLLHNQPLSSIVAQGGIDGQKTLIGRTLIFYRNPLFVDRDWTTGGLFDRADQYFDSTLFDESASYTDNEKSSVFKITVNSAGIVQLVLERIWTAGTKVPIRSGTNYANREFLKNTNLTIELLPQLTADLSTLRYQSGTVPQHGGTINLIDIDLGNGINVEQDILGKLYYTSPNGVVFTNGLKIRFDSSVLPEKYKNNEYYVELVGTGIRLVLVDSLITPESYIQTLLAAFEETLFDQGGYETKNVGPLDPEYFVINRSSLDVNAWSRVNRWFHYDVIRATEQYNNIQIDLTSYARGRRPILEYDPDIALYNHGTVLFDVIDLIDTTTTDPLSDLAYTGVESALNSKMIDGVELANGFRVVFTAATDLSVKNKIYTVQIADFLGNGVKRLSLQDTGRYISANSNIIVADGTVKKGVTYVLKNGVMLAAQQKTRVNQPPLFDLFDVDGVSYSDSDIYPNTTFVGNKLLSYRVGFGVADPVLDMPLSYRSIGNVGDIQFENFVVTGTFSYNGASHSTANGNIYQNGSPVQTWILSKDLSYQRQMFEFTYTDNQQFEVDVTPIDSKKSVEVNVNGVFLGIEGFIYHVDTIKNKKYVSITKALAADDAVNILIHSDETSAVAHYEIPFNLNNNSNNDELTYLTLGQLRNHIVAQYQNYVKATNPDNYAAFDGYIDGNRLIVTKMFAGTIRLGMTITGATVLDSTFITATKSTITTLSGGGGVGSYYINRTQYTACIMTGILSNANLSFPGTVSIRDYPQVRNYPGTIFQHSAPLLPAMFFLSNPNLDFVDSIELARSSYSFFKKRFLEAAVTLPVLDYTNTAASVDTIMEYLNENKSDDMPYYYSDMVPYGSVVSITTYTVKDTARVEYGIESFFNDAVSSQRAVLVYHNGQQLVRGRHYVFDKTSPGINLLTSLPFNSILEIHDYSNTAGSYVPETPAKMGLAAAVAPEITTDRSYQTAQTVIIGHDGSSTIAFGDFRDQLLLELELRIYNNIKRKYDSARVNFYNILPGGFRNTGYTQDQINSVLAPYYYRWRTENGLNYVNDSYYKNSDPWTWNYYNQLAKDGTRLLGSWHAVYKYYYDTSEPDTKPWEMLGYVMKPTWWNTKYGPAPYTSGNQVLWDDIRDGVITADDGSTSINKAFARPNIYDYIPVDSQGIKRTPLTLFVKVFNGSITNAAYRFGMIDSVENSWRKSSDYAYAVQIAMAVLKPAQYFALMAL